MGHQNFEEIMGVTASLVMTSALVTLLAALSITDIPAVRTDCLFIKSPKSALAEEETVGVHSLNFRFVSLVLLGE